MSELINMPHITVEQVVRFRSKALQVERDLTARVAELEQELAKAKPAKDLTYTDPETTCPEMENTLHQVSGLVAGQAFNDLCRMIGGRWPDARMEQEAPKAYRFFLELLSGEKGKPQTDSLACKQYSELLTLLESKNFDEAIDMVKFLLKLSDSSHVGSAIEFALQDEDGEQFLRFWNEGQFDVIRKEWPEAPEAVFPST